ncbi:hypothetical protein V8G54_035217 [Vigna mungo]|uniref:non-specific serine/threonine protein kinase n=1 Tax=Vigna mungo TaxID=3915 RepID=A0AAQ3RAG6_VIGMU
MPVRSFWGWWSLLSLRALSNLGKNKKIKKEAEKPARFTYADLKRITNGFKEMLGEGAHGAVFRGKLSSEIPVAVKILNNTEGEGNEFINEVGIMGKIHHINVVRLLGFCAEGLHRALVYNFFPNGSLQSFIFPPEDMDHFLGWEKLQHIALGIAKGIEYLHQGCNHPIIHFDINPHNVLLDDNFTPKISDFGLAKLCSKNPSLVSMTAARRTLGYIAPEVFSRNFGNVSYKSDIYSYGMLLLEMVGGRKNVDMSSPEDFHVLYPDWIHNLVDGDVRIHVEDEDDFKIAKKLAIIGLWCIQWQPGNRPSIKSVIHMLETQEENQIAVPPNPFHSATSTTVKGPISTRRPLHLEGLLIPISRSTFTGTTPSWAKVEERTVKAIGDFASEGSRTTPSRLMLSVLEIPTGTFWRPPWGRVANPNGDHEEHGGTTKHQKDDQKQRRAFGLNITTPYQHQEISLKRRLHSMSYHLYMEHLQQDKCF